MTNSFYCSFCGTLLMLPDDQTDSVQCPNCHATVPVPEELRRSQSDDRLEQYMQAFPDISDAVNHIKAKSDRLKEMVQLTRDGKKIEAIKIYREVFGGGLVEAKNAIEKLQATGRLDAPSTTITTSTRIEMPGLNEAQVAEIIQLLRGNHKIEAIKRYRQITNAGLHEAKTGVELIEKQPNSLQPGAVPINSLPVPSTIEAPPFPSADIGITEGKSNRARTFRLIVGAIIILMLVAIAVLSLLVFTGH